MAAHRRRGSRTVPSPGRRAPAIRDILLPAGSYIFGAVLVALSQGSPLAAESGGSIAWGSSVTISSGGWGRLARRTDGEWLAVATHFPAGEPSKLGVYRGGKHGRAWTLIAELAEPGRRLDNGNLIALEDGSVLLTGRSLIEDESFRLPVYRSRDGGRSWTYLSAIDSNEGAPGTLRGKGLWEPYLHVLEDGRIAAFYSSEKHAGYSQIVSEKVSPDGGLSWGTEIWAAAQPGGGSLRPGMPVVARLADARRILVYEVVGLGNGDVHAKVSGDGETWEQGLGVRVPGHRCGPYVAAVADGRLFLSSCENVISLSEDLGESWVRVDPPAWDLGFAFSWPALYEIREAELGAVVTAGGVKMRIGTLVATGSPAPPELFRDDFSSGDGAGWTLYGGSFSVEGGSCVLRNAGGYGKAMAGSVFWKDGVAEARVLLETPGNAGLMFRTLNPDSTGPDDAFGYYAGVDSDGSPGAGFVVLGRMDGGWERLASAAVAIPLNTWHRLKVRMDGSSIRVYVDDMGRPKIAISDGTHPRGQIGVRSFRCDARFDDVSFHAGVPFRARGDSNGDGAVDVSDSVFTLGFLFLGGPAPACFDGADSNDDSVVDLSDAVYSLEWLFAGGSPPPEPFERCDWDPTPDGLDCRAYDGCP